MLFFTLFPRLEHPAGVDVCALQIFIIIIIIIIIISISIASHTRQMIPTIAIYWILHNILLNESTCKYFSGFFVHLYQTDIEWAIKN